MSNALKIMMSIIAISLIATYVQLFHHNQISLFKNARAEVTAENLYRVLDYDKFLESGGKWYREGDEAIHVKYVGEIKDGVPNGLGEEYFEGEKFFVGHFTNGYRDGFGTLTNDKYVGLGIRFYIEDESVKITFVNENSPAFNAGILAGDNIIQINETPLKDLSYTEISDLMDGEKGTLISLKMFRHPESFEVEIIRDLIASEDKYEGEFQKGKKDGQGTYTWFFDGATYVGEWKDDKFHGQGTFTWPNGDQYVGEHKNGLRDGEGTSIFFDGDTYVGEWKEDMIHGNGTYTWSNGIQYVGEWKNGLKDGEGAITYSDGATHFGEWKNDKPHGKGTKTFADGGLYVGEFKNGKMHGHGTFIFPDGGQYIGEWKNDKRNGLGSQTLTNGSKYFGNFKDGKYQGQGIYIHHNEIMKWGEHKEDELWEGVIFDKSNKIINDVNNGVEQNPSGAIAEIIEQLVGTKEALKRKVDVKLGITTTAQKKRYCQRPNGTVYDTLSVSNKPCAQAKEISKTVYDNIKSGKTNQKETVVKSQLPKNDHKIFDEFIKFDPSAIKRIYLVAIEQINFGREILMGKRIAKISASEIKEVSKKLLTIISKHKYEEATTLLTALEINANPNLFVKDIVHTLGDPFVYMLSYSDLEQSQPTIEQLGEKIEIEILQGPPWLSIDVSGASNYAKLNATEDIGVGNFKLILVITDNLLGNRIYRNMTISVEPPIFKIHGYGFLLESETIESPDECFNALIKGVVLNLTDSTKDSYVEILENEYYYYKSNLYSFGINKFSWEKYKKYFTCEKFHINQDDDNIELFTRDIKIPIE